MSGRGETRATQRERAEVAAGVRVDLHSLLALRHAAGGMPLETHLIRAQEAGGRRSPFKGRGMEFEESRPYEPGDDLRSLDWRVTARTGKPHTKLFREERERPVLLWVDLRSSMFFATHGAFKAVVAARAGAILAWCALRHGDRLGGLVFSDGLHLELRPQRGKGAVLRFIDALATHPAWSGQATDGESAGTASAALLRLQRVVRPGSLVFLLSDFRDLGEDVDVNFARLSRHSDTVLMHVSDPLEQELPPPGTYRVRNAVERLTLDTRDANRRQVYRERFAAHRAHLQSLCVRHRMHVFDCGTGDDVQTALRTGLGLGPGARPGSGS